MDMDKSDHSLDAEKSSLSDIEEARIRKSLLWKLDTRILPVLAVLFLFSFLDRTNIGNAKVLGYITELKLSTIQYQTCLAVYFAFYIISEVPSNLVIKKVSPKIWLPLLTVVWGIIAAMMGVVTSFEGLVVVRSLLGIAEGGLLPGMVLYLSMLYKREELAVRMGLVYSSASLSGAFGGLLATGINNGMEGVGGYKGYRWIFIVEGLMTVVVGIIAYYLLINSVETAHFLTEEEKAYAVARLAAAKPHAVDGAESVDAFSWYQVWRGVFSVQTWLSASAYFAILSALYSFGLFLPSIITGLGYSAIQAQLYSVPPYVVAATLTVIVAFGSDRTRMRGPWMLGCLPLSIIGYAIIRSTNNNSVKYGATFLMASGLYASVPPVLVWINSNSSPYYKRATAQGLQLSIANCGGFVATFSYPAAQAPAYVPSHTIILGLICAAWGFVALNVTYCWYQNKQKAAGKMDQYIGSGCDRDPSFKYVL